MLGLGAWATFNAEVLTGEFEEWTTGMIVQHDFSDEFRRGKQKEVVRKLDVDVVDNYPQRAENLVRKVNEEFGLEEPELTLGDHRTSAFFYCNEVGLLVANTDDGQGSYVHRAFIDVPFFSAPEDGRNDRQMTWENSDDWRNSLLEVDPGLTLDDIPYMSTARKVEIATFVLKTIAEDRMSLSV